jgi:predicted HTH domain antitoxin
MQITISIPDKPFVAEPRDSISRKICLYAALGLYRARELSIGAACELAGVDRYTFLDFCKRQGVVLQTLTPTELEAEFHRLIGE